MNLETCLSMLPSSHLRKLAERYGLPFLGESPSELVNGLGSYLLNPPDIESVLQTLSASERMALDFLLFSNEDGLHRLRCHRQLRQFAGLSHDSARSQYVSLMRRGLLFQGRRGWEELYFVPEDLKLVMATWSLKTLVEASALHESDVKITQLPPDLLVRQAHWFLAHCYKHSPRITQQGRIYKRDQQDLFASLGWPMPDTGTPLFMPDEHHLEPVQFLLAYFEGADVIDGSGKTVELTDRLGWWLALPPSTKRAELADYLLYNYPSTPSLPLALFALKNRAGTWVGWDTFVKSLASRLTREDRFGLNALVEGGNDAIWLSGLPLFAGLGLVEVGVLGEEQEGTEQALAVRWAPGDPMDEFTPAREFYLQPTFEVLVPLTAEYQLLWGLELIADLEKADRMCIYRLSRATVYRALEEQVTRDEILTFLQEGCRTPIPQNVLYTLREWLDRYGQVRFTEGVVVECANEETARTIQGLTLPGNHRPVQIGPRHFLIDPLDHGALVRQLRELGRLPATTIHTLYGEDDRPAVRLQYEQTSADQSGRTGRDRESKRIPAPRFWTYRWHRPDITELSNFVPRHPVALDPRSDVDDDESTHEPDSAGY